MKSALTCTFGDKMWVKVYLSVKQKGEHVFEKEKTTNRSTKYKFSGVSGSSLSNGTRTKARQ